MIKLFRSYRNRGSFESWNAEKYRMQQKEEILYSNAGKCCLEQEGGRGLKKPCGNFWCNPDWIFPQNCRNVLPLHKVGQLVRSEENEILFYLCELGIRHGLDGTISYCKDVCVFTRAIA